jgi:hypothetical protein
MTTVAVATYNMSFASDSGLNPDGNGNFASEAAFLKSNPSADPRAFWLNAVEVVKKFWTEVPNAGVMGFQELNKTAEGTITGSAVLAALAKEKGLAFAVDEVITPFSKPALGVMWNPTFFGDYASHSIKDLEYPLEEVGLPGQKGRPLLVVSTTKGFTLVVLHAPNHEKLAEGTQQDLKKAIRSTLDAIPGVTAEKTFIMGDFNDRYDALTSIEVPGGVLRYEGKAPLSCCHNWDSSCSDSRYEDLSAKLSREKVGRCKLPTYPEGTKNAKGANVTGKPYVLAGPGVRIAMGTEGDIGNYRYYGDKVFGAKPVSNIQMYPPGRTGGSKESDHEMVMAEYEIPVTAGGVHRGRKHTRKGKKRTSKKKQTRKH